MRNTNINTNSYQLQWKKAEDELKDCLEKLVEICPEKKEEKAGMCCTKPPDYLNWKKYCLNT